MKSKEKHSEKLILNLGCGEQTYGDVRVDFYRGKANVLADAQQSLPFKNDIFDQVYSRCFFEHLKNPSIHLNEAVRVLKPGGKIIIITDNAAYIPFHLPTKFGSGCHSLVGYKGASTLDKHYALYTIEHIKNHLLDQNLRINAIRYVYSSDVGCCGGPIQIITRFLSLSTILPVLNPFFHPHILAVSTKSLEKRGK